MDYKKQPKVRIKETGEVKRPIDLHYDQYTEELRGVLIVSGGGFSAEPVELDVDEIEFITDDKVSLGTTTNHRIKMQNKTEEDKCVCGQEWVDEECPLHQPKNSIDSDTADKLRKNVKESREEWGCDCPVFETCEKCESDTTLEPIGEKKVSDCCGVEWKHAFECYVDDMGNQKPYTCKSCGEPCKAVEGEREYRVRITLDPEYTVSVRINQHDFETLSSQLSKNDVDGKVITINKRVPNGTFPKKSECLECGEEFMRKRSRNKYCSKTCASKQCNKNDDRILLQKKDGEVINEWDSQTEAAESEEGLNNKYISQVCNGYTKTHGGYEWEWIDPDNLSTNHE